MLTEIETTMTGTGDDSVLTDLAAVIVRVRGAIEDLESERAEAERKHVARLAAIDTRMTALRAALNGHAAESAPGGGDPSREDRPTCPRCGRSFTFVRNLARHAQSCRA